MNVTITITEVSTPTFQFAVSVSNGDTFTFKQMASDQNAAIDAMVAELAAISAQLSAQKV